MSTDLRPTPVRPGRTRIVLLALAAVVLAWGSAAVVGWAALGTVPGQFLDEQALRAARRLAFLGDRTLQVLDTLPLVGAVVGALALVVLSVRARSMRAAVVGLGVAVAAAGSVQVLKRLVIQKPNLEVQAVALNSFPSGHTTMAAVAGMVLVLAVPARARPTVGLLAACYTATAGASTIVNGWHRPSDVIAAVFITAGWAMLGSLVLRLGGRRLRDRAAGVDARPAAVGHLGAAGVIGMVGGSACVLAAGATALPALAGWGLPWALLSGMATVLGACLLSYAALAALTRHG